MPVIIIRPGFMSAHVTLTLRSRSGPLCRLPLTSYYIYAYVVRVCNTNMFACVFRCKGMGIFRLGDIASDSFKYNVVHRIKKVDIIYYSRAYSVCCVCCLIGCDARVNERQAWRVVPCAPCLAECLALIKTSPRNVVLLHLRNAPCFARKIPYIGPPPTADGDRRL